MATKTTPTPKAKAKNKATKPEAEAPELLDVEVEEFEDVEGSHLLKPLSQLTASEQMRLMHRFQVLAIDTEGEGEGEEQEVPLGAATLNVDLEAFADLTDYIGNNYARSRAEFLKFGKGAGGQKRTLRLIMAYVTELGKGLQ